jgi:hypothetical protein
MPFAKRAGFIVRVFHNNNPGRAAGIGFVVGEQQIVTCAHVVNTALGRDEHFQNAPRPEERVQIDFPLLDEGAGSTRRECRVDQWTAPPSQGISGGGDVAGLVVVGAELPHGAGPARLILTDSATGTEVEAFGYGDEDRALQGAWAALRLRGTVGFGNIQLDAETESAFRPRPGYSGSPVIPCKEDGDVVVGMLAVAREGDLNDSYAIPVARIAAAWHAVLGDLLTAPPAPAEAVGVGVSGEPLAATPPSMPQPVSSPAAMADLGARPIAQQPTATQPEPAEPSLPEVIPGDWMIDIQLPQGTSVKLMLALMMPPASQPQFQGTFIGTPMPMQVRGYWWVMGSQLRLTGVQTIAAALPMQNPYDVVVTFASWSHTQLIGVTSNGERVVWQRQN